MSRRLVNPTRRLSDSESIPVGGSPQKKSHNSPLLSIGLILVGAFLLIGYFYKNSGEYAIRKEVSITGGAIRKEVSITGGGFPGQQKVKISQQSKFGRMAKLRSPSWWQKYFHQSGLNEDAAATEKFKKASSKSSYEPSCQIFHLSS